MGKKFVLTARIFIALAMFVAALGLAVQPAAAATTIEIPYGATITSATLKLYSYQVWGPDKLVNVHPVTAPWDETTVTWASFNGAFGSTVSNFLVSAPQSYYTADVTALAQAWLAGQSNYGLLLETPVVEADNFAIFYSREGPISPTLEICYDYNGSPTCISDLVPVADASVWELFPDQNYGTSIALHVGRVAGYTKYTLIKFDIQPGRPTGPGTGTPGYWKTHPEAWPVDSITIGNVVYSKADAIKYMMMDDSLDKTMTMFRALVSAKLNVMIGNPSGCIDSTIQLADAWMVSYGPVTNGVLAKSLAWKAGEPLYLTLDAYNNGLMCAVHRQ